MKLKRTKMGGRYIPIILLSFMFLFVAAPAVLAQTAVTGGPDTPEELKNVIVNIGKWFQAIVLAIAVVMIIAAGLMWMTAGGNDDKLTTARKMLVWGLVGIAVAIFAFGAQAFIKAILGIS